MTRHATWYAKDSLTFFDIIALVRRSMERSDLRRGGAQGRHAENTPCIVRPPDRNRLLRGVDGQSRA